MQKTNSFEKKSLSGWGCAFYSKSKVFCPSSVNEIQELINSSEPGYIIARGLGRSYGNPAQCDNGSVVDMTLVNHISLDIESATIKAGGGASIDDILKIIVPKGFFIPVSAGTRYVTVAGAVAADIHGKNHHIEGSFANHVTEIKIIDGLGDLKTLRPDSNTSKEIMKFLQQLNEEGKTILIVTHEQDISLMCKRIVRLKDGIIIEDKKIKQNKIN